MDIRIRSKLTTSLADGGAPLAPRTVKQCYEITNLSLHVGIEDYTEGIYTGNGRIWSFDSIPTYDRDFKTVKRWYLNGMNYNKTLAQWLKNFDESYPNIKDLDYGMDFAKFRRIWRFYLMWVRSNFASCDGEVIGNGQFLMVHS